jgi:hypothetical protein
MLPVPLASTANTFVGKFIISRIRSPGSAIFINLFPFIKWKIHTPDTFARHLESLVQKLHTISNTRNIQTTALSFAASAIAPLTSPGLE